MYTPVIGVNPDTGITSTNSWVLKPGFNKGIQLVGDIAPVPWAGLASQLLMGALGVGGAMYGRQYRKAGRSLVETVDVYRQGTRKLSGGAEFDDSAVKTMAAKHASNGVGKVIFKLVEMFTGRTKV